MGTQRQVNILMVDDQPAKLMSYEVMLGELGENLIKANSGREALEILLKTDVAVVLMDVSMPELDGFELADMIRQHPRFQKLAIIFISAVHLTDLDRLKGYQRGAVDYISVPVIPELLRAKVAVFAELHRRAQQLEALNRELRRLSSSLIAMQDEERRRIARELHDGLGQELTAAKMIVDGILLQDVSNPVSRHAAADASGLIDRAIQQVRSISHLLHPPLLDEVGLLSALRWFLEGLTKRSGIETFLDVQPPEFPRLPSEMETATFRIIQEALNNVFRHSGAKNGWIALHQKNGQLTVTIRDDGKGVAESVMEFRGELRLTKASPGTLVEVMIPTKHLSLSPLPKNPAPASSLASISK
jgi:signal transduction histidine kinase